MCVLCVLRVALQYDTYLVGKEILSDFRLDVCCDACKSINFFGCTAAEVNESERAAEKLQDVRVDCIQRNEERDAIGS